MSQKFIREVICDCCGGLVNDIVTGYQVTRVGSGQLLYDICNNCYDELTLRRRTLEQELIDTVFTNKEGRED